MNLLKIILIWILLAIFIISIIVVISGQTFSIVNKMNDESKKITTENKISTVTIVNQTKQCVNSTQQNIINGFKRLSDNV